MADTAKGGGGDAGTEMDTEQDNVMGGVTYLCGGQLCIMFDWYLESWRYFVLCG